jgi:hypothetical protein
MEKIKRNNCGNIKEFGDFSLIDHTKWKKICHKKKETMT